MAKVMWKPGTMLNPVPVVMVSCRNNQGQDNIITIAWVGTICSDPPMLSISVRPERYSYDIIKDTGEFVVNLTTEKLAHKTDYCGVKSGKDVDKFESAKLTPLPASIVKAPLISESPINLECKVKQVMPLGSHHMFLAEIVAVHVDEKLIDKNGKLCMEKAKLICYSHGQYYSLKDIIGHFGYSVKKKKRSK